MKEIKPMKMFNIWFIKHSKTTYDLVDTIDINIDFNMDKFLEIFKKVSTAFTSFMVTKELGKLVQEEIKKDPIFEEYDACVWSNTSSWTKTGVKVSIDVFKKVGCFRKIRNWFYELWMGDMAEKLEKKYGGTEIDISQIPKNKTIGE